MLYRGRTFHVHTYDTVEVSLDVAPSVCVRRRVQMDGLLHLRIASEDRVAAFHALVILLGGKSVLVDADPARIGVVVAEDVATIRLGCDMVRGTVYVLGKHSADAPGRRCVADEPVLDVAEFYTAMAATGFARRDVQRFLNGRGAA